MVKLDIKHNRTTIVETQLPSACVLAIPMLYVRPYSKLFAFKIS